MELPEGSEIIIRSIQADDRSGAFKTGDSLFQPLKTFLQNQAQEFQAGQIACTYVAVRADQPNQIIAYITLICSEIDVRAGYELQGSQHAQRYDSLPAVKIARLAVDSRYRSLGIGESLIATAVSIANDEIAPHVGCRFLVTDAKQASVSFYTRMGFTLLDTAANREAEQPVMFVDLAKLGD